MSSDPLFIAYNWIGPMGPIHNLTTPDIYDMARVENAECVNVLQKSNNKQENFGMQCVNTNTQLGTNFRIAPVCTMTDTDIFIYPVTLGYKDDMSFLFKSPHGIFERGRILSTTLEKIKTGRGYLLLDHGSESFVSDQNLDYVHGYIKSYDIPMHKVIYATGTGNIHQLYEEYCISRNILHPANKIKFTRYYPYMEEISAIERGNDLIKSYDTELLPEKRFLSLNLRPRIHRLLLLGLFHKLDLLKDSYFTMGKKELPESGKIMEHIEHTYISGCGLNNDIFLELDKNINDFVLDITEGVVPDYNLDVVRDKYNQASMIKYYSESLLSVVTETTFHTNIMAVTEKSFKPIKYMHPFIIVGTCGSLQNLRDMGYKTFGEFWDESYDDISDNNKRLCKIAEICKDIQSWHDDKVLDFKRKVKATVTFNYNHMVNNPHSDVYTEIAKYIGQT